MSLIDNYNKCLQLIRQEKWSKAKKVISSEPAVLHFCVPEDDTVLIAALKYFCDSEFLQFLIASGSDVNSKDCNGNTPLYHACLNRPYECQRAEDSVNYQTLFQAGARLTPFEALIIASNNLHPDWKKMQQILRDNPEVVSIIDKNGDTLLSRNANVEYCELFEFFLKSAKWDLNLVTSPESGSILGQIWESAYLVNSSDSPKKSEKTAIYENGTYSKIEEHGSRKTAGRGTL